MQLILIALVVLAAASTIYVLTRGIFTMARGKDITGARSNQLMILRVAFQAFTILLVVILFVLAGHRAVG